jgi:hypothetical protein
MWWFLVGMGVLLFSIAWWIEKANESGLIE